MGPVKAEITRILAGQPIRVAAMAGVSAFFYIGILSEPKLRKCNVE